MTKNVYYNKLIRDGIPDKIARNNGTFEVRELNQEEFVQELSKKIIEEAYELAHAKSREEFLSEYADLMIVLDACTREFEFSEADIKTAVEENLKKKGAYTKRLFLHFSSDDNYPRNETQ